MCNYFGLGVDAAVALDFHQMRERRPYLFFSRVVNKLWYMWKGATTLMENRCKEIGSKVKLECDGEEVQIPEDLEGVIVLNIPSFSGGTNLWGQDELEVDESEEDDSEEEADKSDASPRRAVPPLGSKAPDKRNALMGTRQSKQDKKLEVVGVHGVLQLGAAQVGLYSATRLAQASRVKITTRADLPVEVDGEPSWFPRDGEIEIEFRSQAFMLAREPEGKHSVATDIVDWALQRNLINHSVRDELMQEIARRSQAVPRISSSQSAAHALGSG
jgi:diacylglycerol kinase (ATP)